MSLSVLNWLSPIAGLLFWTASGVVSLFLAFETLYPTEVLLIGFWGEILTTVFSHTVLIFEVINFFNMSGAMVTMVEVVVIFSTQAVFINITTMVVMVFMVVGLKTNMFLM